MPSISQSVTILRGEGDKTVDGRGPLPQLPRLFECALCFFVLPPCLYLIRHWLAFRLIPLTVVIAITGALQLHREGVDRRILWSTAGLRTHLRAILAFFLPVAVIIGSLTACAFPQYFLAFPLGSPRLWAVVMVLYPLLAAYPQELIFRAFFLHRYQALFPSDAAFVVFNGLSFGLAHLLYGNWIAIILATPGGFLFAYRYLRTGSLLAVSLEHGLWGDFVFTIGLGHFLYSGAIR